MLDFGALTVLWYNWNIKEQQMWLDATARAAAEAEQNQRKLHFQMRVKWVYFLTKRQLCSWAQSPCVSSLKTDPADQWTSLSSDLHFHYSPLINVVSFKCVNSVNVWYVKNWLITWRVCGQLHKDFIKENRLKEKQMSLWQHHPVTAGRNSICMFKYTVLLWGKWKS